MIQIGDRVFVLIEYEDDERQCNAYGLRGIGPLQTGSLDSGSSLRTENMA